MGRGIYGNFIVIRIKRLYRISEGISARGDLNAGYIKKKKKNFTQ